MKRRDITPAELKEYLKKPSKGNRYLAKKTKLDGYKFDSKAESERYSYLRLRLMAREISELTLQPSYSIDVNGVHIGEYSADFRYYDRLTGKVVVEDVKSKRTAKLEAYRLRLKLVEAIHGIKVVEILAT